MTTKSLERPKLEYPDSDGLPMAENTKQFRWIVTIKEGLDALFRADPQVFVAGDLFWYPTEGEPTIRVAPGQAGVGGPVRRRRGGQAGGPGDLPSVPAVRG